MAFRRPRSTSNTEQAPTRRPPVLPAAPSEVTQGMTRDMAPYGTQAVGAPGCAESPEITVTVERGRVTSAEASGTLFSQYAQREASQDRRSPFYRSAPPAPTWAGGESMFNTPHRRTSAAHSRTATPEPASQSTGGTSDGFIRVRHGSLPVLNNRTHEEQERLDSVERKALGLCSKFKLR